MKLVVQKTDHDCGIACLATLLGRSYEDVYLEVAKVDAKRCRKGLWMTQIKKAAKALGVTLTAKRRFDAEEAVGILSVTSVDDDCPTDHVVVLWNHMILDTDGTLYGYDDYFILNHAKAGSLLVLKE